MKKNVPPVTLQGAINLEIDPSDTLLWKLSMVFEAAHNSDLTIEQISSKYGYTREYFYQVLNKLRTEGSKTLQDKVTGPKTNYKRTAEIKKQVIRHRFLDPDASCEVIAQKMRQSGFDISQRSVERVVQEFGLQKKGFIRQVRKMRKNQ